MYINSIHSQRNTEFTECLVDMVGRSFRCLYFVCEVWRNLKWKALRNRKPVFSSFKKKKISPFQIVYAAYYWLCFQFLSWNYTVTSVWLRVRNLPFMLKWNSDKHDKIVPSMRRLLPNRGQDRGEHLWTSEERKQRDTLGLDTLHEKLRLI